MFLIGPRHDAVPVSVVVYSTALQLRHQTQLHQQLLQQLQQQLQHVSRWAAPLCCTGQCSCLLHSTATTTSNTTTTTNSTTTTVANDIGPLTGYISPPQVIYKG